MRKYLFQTMLVGVLALLPVSTILAQTFTWNGNGSDNNWNTGGNWVGGVAPTSATNRVIVFDGVNRTNTTQNILEPFQLNQLIQQTGATNGFRISGSGIQFAGTPGDTGNPSAGALLQNNTTAAFRIDSTVDFSVNTVIDVNRNATGQFYELILAGALTGNSTITKLSTDGGNINPEALILSRNNSFSGTWNNNQGITYLGAINALSRTATINTGSALSSVRLNTPAVAGQGITDGGFNQQIGTLTGSGAINLGNSATNAASILVGFNSTNNTFGGAIDSSAVETHFAKVGTGTLTYTGSRSGSTALGSLSVRDGTLQMQGSNGRYTTSSTNVGAISIYSGGSLILSNTTNNQQDRLANNATVRLSGGTLRLEGSSNAGGTSELLGALNLVSGQSTVLIVPGTNRAARFNFQGSGANFGQILPTATVFFQGNSLGAQGFGGGDSANIANVRFATAPTLIGGGGAAGSTNISILAPAFSEVDVSGSPTQTLVTYDATNQSIRALTTSEYASGFGQATDNVRLTANATVSTAQTANALVLSGTTNTVTLNAALTLTSGVLLNSAGTSVTLPSAAGGALAFGTNGDATAYVTSNGNLTLGTSLSAGHFAKSGTGTVTVNNLVVLNGTGERRVAVNSGTLTLGNGANFNTNQALTYDVSRGATLDVTAQGLTLGNNRTLRGNGLVNGTVTVANGGSIIASALSGPDASLASPGTLTLGTLVLQAGGSSTIYINSIQEGLYNNSLLVGNTLDLTGLTNANRFTFRLDSLALSNADGNVYDFDVSENKVYEWTIGTFTTINGFDSNKFTIDTSGFSNSLGGGTFTVLQQGNNLILNFNPVPEPASILGIAAAGLGAVQWLRRRRRVVNQPIESKG